MTVFSLRFTTISFTLSMVSYYKSTIDTLKNDYLRRMLHRWI